MPHTRQSIAKAMVDIRHSLTHQYSLPSSVRLTNDNLGAERFGKQYSDEYVISTLSLTQAVWKTAISMVRSNPEAVFDPQQPSRGIDRDTANRSVEPYWSA